MDCLAAASAFMYISRYAISGAGACCSCRRRRGFSDVEAISVVSINALLGILGTVLSGVVLEPSSFKGRKEFRR